MVIRDLLKTVSVECKRRKTDWRGSRMELEERNKYTSYFRKNPEKSLILQSAEKVLCIVMNKACLSEWIFNGVN